MLIHYIDNNEKATAAYFIHQYLRDSEINTDVKRRIKIHLLHQRILDWGNAKATDRGTWDDDLSFSEWAGSVLQFIDGFIGDI